MSRIKNAFTNKKAFIGFLTGGDPNIATTEKLIYEMADKGADLIEIGIPFSDPIAEGPVIQEANERALKVGCTTDKLFDMVKRVREKLEIPLVFLTYINPIYTYGADRFMETCKLCGIDGVIVPDMPYEEAGELSEICRKHSVDIISLIAPTSNERIQMIASKSKGFLYCVSSLGVTGVRSEIQSDISKMIESVKEVTDIPCAIGFGIATPDQAKEMVQYGDGVIVGSAIVKLIASYGEDSIIPVGKYIKQMKEAIN